MTQLEALVTLIDAVSCIPRNRHLDAAIKKIEARIAVLQGRRRRRLSGKKTMPL